MAGRLFTGRYVWFRHGAPHGLVVCGITVGSPRFPMASPIDWSLRWLAPWGMLDVNDEQEFAQKYTARLDRMGEATVRGRLHRLQEKHDGSNLLLACFEDVTQPGEWCHRRVLAGWLEAHDFGEVREWTP